MINQRQPLEILKEVAMVLNAQDQIARSVQELAENQNYRNVQTAQVEKIIRQRLAVHGVCQEKIETFVAQYLAAKGN